MIKSKFVLFLSFTSCFFLRSFSQSPVVSSDSNEVEVIQDVRIADMLNKKIEISKKTSGKVAGFRVQVHSGSDRNKAKETKSKFMTKYPDIQAYEIYQQPNFKIRAGDFRTKLEAFRFLKQLSAEFSGAFIVEDKVEMEKAE